MPGGAIDVASLGREECDKQAISNEEDDAHNNLHQENISLFITDNQQLSG